MITPADPLDQPAQQPSPEGNGEPVESQLIDGRQASLVELDGGDSSAGELAFARCPHLPSFAGEVPPSYGGGGVRGFRTAGVSPTHDHERAARPRTLTHDPSAP